MDFRRIEGSGGSEISKFTYVSENVLESKASSCVPVTPLKPEQVRTHMPQVNEAYLSSQVGIYGSSSGMPAARNGYLQQSWLLPSHNFPELLYGSHQAARNGSYQQGLILPSQVFLREGMSAAVNGSHQQSMILPSPVLQWADGSPAAGMQATSSAGGGRFTPFLLEQINRAVPRPPTAAPRVVGQNQQFALNSLSKDGFPVPYRANYDLNSPARADVSDETIGFSIAPVTPDRGGRVEKGQSVENVVSTATGISREKRQEESPLPRPLPLGNQLVEVSLPTTMFSKQKAGNRALCQPLYSSQAVGCTPSSMVFQQLVSSPIAVTTSSANATQGLSQPPEPLPSIIPDNPLKENHSLPQPSSGVPSTPVKESQGLFQSVESSTAVDSVPVKEINFPLKGENKGIDLNEAPAQELNKTPAQKPPRRKKHRPKVIREDKPKKTPKPKTPKQAANKGNSTGKRKYVRKTGPKVSSMPQSTDERETSNLENRASKKSCRRSLNFDSEVHAGDQEPITNMQQDRLNGGLNNAASNNVACGIQSVNMVRTFDGSFGLSYTAGPKPTLQLGNGLEVVALDLHCSVNAVLEKYISLPENPSSPIAREGHIKENSSSSSGRQTGFMGQGIDSGHDGKIPTHQSVQPSEANHSSGHHNAHAVGLNYIRNPISSGQQDHDSSSLYRLQNGIQAVSESQHRSNISVPVQVATNNHAKASNVVNCPMSQIEPASSAPHSMLESDLNKAKMATLSSMKGVMTTAALQTSIHWPFSSPSVVKEGERTAENSSYTRPAQSDNVIKEQHKVQNIFDRYFTDLNREMRVNHYQQVQNGLLEQEHAEKRKKLKSNPSIKSLSHTLPALPALVIQSQHRQIQSSHGAAQRHDNGRAGNIVHGTLALVDALANTIPKVKTKRRTTKAQARIREGPPSYAPYQGYMEPRGARLGQKSTKRNTSLHKDGKPTTTLGFPINDEQGRSNLHSKPNTSFQLQLYKVIEEVICGVQNLNINAENTQHALVNVENAQNALVPFTGEGTMVLYDGQADPVKKRRPRAKVDLDEETNRVWKLLMWKEGSDGSEGIDTEKGKYWEEQRQIFRGRADSFIARMHLVQGDRRFSPWKGSVVDSVVGVFLTQNVSDHLSSSAFMALAARFPPKSRGENVLPNGEGRSASMEEDMCSAETAETIKWHDKLSSTQACDPSSLPRAHLPYRKEVATRGENVLPNGEGRSASMEEDMCSAETAETIKWHDKLSSTQACDPSSLPRAHLPYRKEVANCNESFGSNAGNSTLNHSKSDSHTSCISDPETYRESHKNKTDALIAVTESPCFTDMEERKVEDYVISSQTSIISSQNSTDSTPQATDRIGSTSESNSEAENLMTEFGRNPYAGPTSFTELLAMALSLDHNSYGNGIPLSVENNEGACGHFRGSVCGQTSSRFGGLVLPDTCPSIGRVDYLQQQEHHMFEDVVGNSSDCYHLQTQLSMGQTDRAYIRVPSERRPFHSTANEVGERDVYFAGDIACGAGNEIESRAQQNLLVGSQNVRTSNFLELLTKNSLHASSTSEAEACCVGNQTLIDSLPMERNEKALTNENVNHMVNFNHKMGEECLQSHFTAVPGCRVAAEVSSQKEISRIQQNTSNLANYLGDALDVVESSRLANDTKSLERKVEELKSKDEGHTSKVASAEITKGTPKARKGRNKSEKKQDFDWDSLRREACCNGQKERTSNRMDSLDWEAVRLAEVREVSDTIKERGMNNMLAERIKDFLNRLVNDHGSIDLEWLRDIPPEKAKEYLLSIRGLGLKSVECVRLLTLHHLAFPVDTNVGRICVRLGWVPLQPLPESLQLHLLELYPMLENIQKYLWPRLCTLDQRTLYELHYQMITFGKVFCTKSKPNCNSCPMRAECRHFASAFASARLALPGPEEKGLVTATIPLAAEQNAKWFINQLPLPSLGTSPLSPIGSGNKTCEPIIEEPSTPEPEHKEVTEADIEDAFWEDDPDEIPTIKLNIEELSVNVQNYMQETNMDLEDFDVSKALVALSPDTASIPVPKLKNVSRLRTEHQVYELPDSHPVLKGLDKREPDDPCSYLLAIWKPGETAQSTQPPESCCSRQPGQLCHEETCFSCNSMREANAQTVRGTLLIPCRTAMRGSFPLNGTYFQVNEVFADHDSSIKPIDVPRSWIWNLPRRTVYFGTSVTTIFRGLSTEGIQHCFWRGFVCVRGFDQKTRAPRPLMARLHFPASKFVKNNKKAPTKPDE